MKLFQQGISLNIVIIICLSIVQCYINPPAFSLKSRDTSIVDKVFEGCFNFRTLSRTTSGRILAGCKNALLVLNVDLNLIKNLTFNVCERTDGEITCQQEKSDSYEYYCQNYIRTIIECKDHNPEHRYFVCGTNALRPLCYYVGEDFTRDPKNPTGDCVVSRENKSVGLYNGREIGAFTPDQNVSALFVPEYGVEAYDRLITLTTYNAAGIQGIIRSTDMLNITAGDEIINDKGYNKWLDEPQFVGNPIQYNGRIYFFFREPAKEFDNAGEAVFSRVAAVCMNDTGGEKNSNLDGMWTTYIKARLNCSLQGEYPFYYDHLQDVYQPPNSTDIIFAVFTTQEYGQPGSALCAYSMKEIEYLIEGADLRGQKSANSLWLPYPNTDPAITPRTGSCASPQPKSNYDLIRSYSLVDTPVPNLRNYNQDMSPTLNRQSDNPLLIQNDVRFSQLVVDEDVNTHDIFYIGTDRGTLIKFFMPVGGGDGILSQEINLELMEPVLTMELWPNVEWIFVGTENAIQRIPLNHCGAYNNSDFQKCLTKDPRCMLNTTCPVTLNELIGPEDVTADEGDVVYLFCHATVEEGFSLKLEWFKDDVPLTDGSKFKDYEYLLQGEITYDYQYDQKIENEVRSYLRVFVNKNTRGVYTCRILGGDSVWDTSGKVEMNALTVVTDMSYNLRKVEEERLVNLTTETNDLYNINNQCAISHTELCEDVTGTELEKGLKDPNPYIGMNKIPEKT